MRSEVVETLVRERLLTTDSLDDLEQGTVEVVHEALIRHWDTLKGWIDSDRENLLTRDRLKQAAREWFSAKPEAKPDYLYTGTRWAVASEWAAKHGDELSPTESVFLAESKAVERKRKADEVSFWRGLRPLPLPH